MARDSRPIPFLRPRAGPASWFGAQTAFPPPVPLDVAAMGSIRTGLLGLLAQSAERFDRSFLQGKPLRVSRREQQLVEHLVSAGIVRRLGRPFAVPCLRLFALDGRLIATDLLSHRAPDQVFSLMFEQVYMVRNMRIREGDAVLEIGVGSGVNSLFAAARAQSVCAVDVNPRALAFARFNEALNPGQVLLELHEGSLFEPLEEDRRFDQILVNPPFELVPPDTSWFQHSAGGEDGLDVVRALLPHVHDRLTSRGRFTMITWTPGSRTEMAVLGLCRRALPDCHLTAHVLGEAPLVETAAPFVDSPDYEPWMKRLSDRGITHVHLVFLHAEPSNAPDIEMLSPDEEIAACYEISDGWA